MNRQLCSLFLVFFLMHAFFYIGLGLFVLFAFLTGFPNSCQVS